MLEGLKHLAETDVRQSLIKVTSRDEYPWYDELLDGAHAHRRVVDKLNEAQRAEENRITTNNLLRRVEDWKGHVPESLGLLAMDDELVVTKAGVDRLYHVYLFDKILLCCKEVADVKKPQRKHGKTLLSSAQSSAASNRMKLTPLTLKGRIFVYNLSRVIPSLQGRHSIEHHGRSTHLPS
jgi:cell division control protein 24